jgi:predicted ATP-dependent endonuclease of OLD family
MIIIKDVSIENYRSIIDTPLQLTLGKYNVIVGANNVGKSNILRALQLFFNGTVDSLPYDASVDFPKATSLPHNAQTRITVSMQYDPSKDNRIERAIKTLENESGQTRLSNNELRLRLEYTRQGKPQWRFISKAGLRSIRAGLIEDVVAAVRSSIKFKYLPVGRDIQETISRELSDELIKTVFSGWSGAVKTRRQINETISTLLDRLKPRLTNSGDEITKAISGVFQEIRKLELRLPFHDLETMLPSLIPSLQDKYMTGLKGKGAGIQTSTLLFLLKYLAEHHPQRHNLRITYVWAIEEPESYLHPTRQRAMSSVLQKFSDEVQTMITTHSPHFIPRSKDVVVAIIDKGPDAPHSTFVAGNEYNLARQLLGVSLLDSMYLYPFNIAIEGPSDEILLRGTWEKLFSKGLVSIDPSDIRFIPSGNASGACTLYESLITFGNSSEVKVALIVDGDAAGKKALRGLQERTKNQYNKILKSNTDFFLLEETVEWLTSASVINKIAKERPSQVTVTLNTNIEIISFRVNDGHKNTVARRIIELSSIDDLEDFKKLILLIENSFK